MTDLELNYAIAEALGWVTFPDDVEGCHYWYKDPEKAPFCKSVRIEDFHPINDWNDLMPLVVKHGIFYTKDTCQFHAQGYFRSPILVSNSNLQRALAECLLKVLDHN